MIVVLQADHVCINTLTGVLEPVVQNVSDEECRLIEREIGKGRVLVMPGVATRSTRFNTVIRHDLGLIWRAMVTFRVMVD